MNTHCTLFYILFGLTAALLLLVFGTGLSTKEWADPITVGFCVLVLLGLMGWGLIGSCLSVVYIQRNITAVVLKTDQSLVLTSDGQPVSTVTDHASYERLKDCKYVTLCQDGGVTMYGTTNWFQKFEIVDNSTN